MADKPLLEPKTVMLTRRSWICESAFVGWLGGYSQRRTEAL
jgi:hypothetical protein